MASRSIIETQRKEAERSTQRFATADKQETSDLANSDETLSELETLRYECRRGDLNFLAVNISVTYGLCDRTERIERIKLTRSTHSAHTEIPRQVAVR
jgi:hypothetical protein